MAAIDEIIRSLLPSEDDRGTLYVSWFLTTADPIGDRIAIPEYMHRTWAIGVTPGDAFGGATVSIRGANAAADSLVTLNSVSGGTAATAVAAGMLATMENTLFVAPQLTVVGAGAGLFVSLLARRANILRH